MGGSTTFAGVARLESVAGILASCARTLSAAGYGETAGLLRMAHLDLVIRVHEITDEELHAVASLAGREDAVAWDRPANEDAREI